MICLVTNYRIMLKIGIHYIDDVASLDLRGKFIKGQGGFQLQILVDKVLEAGTRRVLLNMTQVPVADSMAIGEIVRAFKKVQEAGGELKLVGMTDRVYGTLKITRLLDLIESYRTEEEAISSFHRETTQKRKRKASSEAQTASKTTRTRKKSSSVPDQGTA